MNDGLLRRAGARLRIPERLRPHVIPLAAVLLACCVSQIAVLMQRPLAYGPPDSYGWPGFPGYLQLAQRVLTTHQLTDAFRAPGYPLFLAGIFALTGGAHLNAVVYVQTALIIAAALELYLLSYRLSGRRSVATIVAGIIGVNPYVTTWERLLLTETLAYWLAVTLFLVFERYLRQGRTSALLWCTLLSFAAIFTRPIFLLLPAVLYLVVLVRAARMHALRQRWKQVAGACGLIYALVLGYMGANALTTGYFGVSDVTNLDLLGKVLTYRMDQLPLTGNVQQYTQLQADIRAYKRHEPTGFLIAYPAYEANHLALIGAFGRAEIEQHLLVYLKAVIPDTLSGFHTVPIYYAPNSSTPVWLATLARGFRFYARLYLVFPLLLLAAIWQAWRRPEHVGSTISLVVLLAYALTTLTGTLVNYAEYWRMRFPLEWAVTLVGVMFLVELAQTLVRALVPRRNAPAALAGMSSGGTGS